MDWLFYPPWRWVVPLALVLVGTVISGWYGQRRARASRVAWAVERDRLRRAQEYLAVELDGALLPDREFDVPLVELHRDGLVMRTGIGFGMVDGNPAPRRWLRIHAPDGMRYRARRVPRDVSASRREVTVWLPTDADPTAVAAAVDRGVSLARTWLQPG